MKNMNRFLLLAIACTGLFNGFFTHCMFSEYIESIKNKNPKNSELEKKQLEKSIKDIEEKLKEEQAYLVDLQKNCNEAKQKNHSLTVKNYETFIEKSNEKINCFKIRLEEMDKSLEKMKKDTNLNKVADHNSEIITIDKNKNGENNTENFNQNQKQDTKKKNKKSKGLIGHYQMFYNKNINPYFQNANTTLAWFASILPTALTGYLTEYGKPKLWYLPALGLSYWLTHKFVKQGFVEDQDKDYFGSESEYDQTKTTAFWVTKALVGAAIGEGVRIGHTCIAECWHAFMKSRK